MENNTEAKKLMEEMVIKVEQVMDVIRLFEDSRPGSLAFTKLEEAIMWLNVMTHHIKLKPVQELQTAEECAA